MLPSCFSYRRCVAVLCLVASASLGFALLMQYGFDFRPCALCLYQRVPFALMIALCGGATLMRLSEKGSRRVVALCVVLFAVGAAIAGYQAGVEQFWWKGPDGCTGTGIVHIDTNAMPDLFMTTPPVRCDEIVWSLFGLSMAAWNMLFSAGMAALLTGVLVRRRAS